MIGARRDKPWNPPARGADISGIFVLVAAGPFLLPELGVSLGDVVFAVPMFLLAVAALSTARHAATGASRREWLWFAAGAGVAALGSLVALVDAVAGFSPLSAEIIWPLGAALLCGGVATSAARTLPAVRRVRLVDGVIVDALVASTGIFFVVVPGIERGAIASTLVFAALLGALLLAVMLATLARPEERRSSWWLAGALAATAATLALPASGAAPMVGSAAAALWAVAGLALALAVDALAPAGEAQAVRDAAREERRWAMTQILLPLAIVLAFPVIVGVLFAGDDLTPTSVAYFGGFFVLTLVVTFARQVGLLVENRRAALLQQSLRTEAVRRNEELEALAGLATTMTETLEEGSIIERGLNVLHLAARASSSALHTGEGGSALAAAMGAWQTEHVWAQGAREGAVAVAVDTRGRRQVARVPLAARGHRIGHVTLLRPASDPFAERELELLRLLADQLAIALQNARDYRDKLEQSIRDPLTGLYNRRYFFEMLEKEVHRATRYGSTASLVIFDVDDFKAVNDTLGHAAGDEVLRSIAAIAGSLIRSADSFARIGGEEFALLLPETPQLDALFVAERLRTEIGKARILEDRRVTVSGGVSTCPVDATTREELEKKADGALYWAKRHGKNLCAVAGEAVVDPGCERIEAALTPLHALVAAIDAELPGAGDHAERAAAFAVAIGQALGLEGDRLVSLRRAARLHDVGLVAVSGAALAKAGPLDDEELAEVRLHSGVGASMLMHAGLIEEALWVRHHHERIDGSGYPDRLAGDDIPFESRILHVADAFEAMTAPRPYRSSPLSPEEAITELRAGAGTQFDGVVVEALAGLVAGRALPAVAPQPDLEPGR